MKVEMGTRYECKELGEMRILCVDSKHPEGPVLAEHLATGDVYRYTAKGSHAYGNSQYNLTEISIYADFVCDEPVMVRDSAALPWQRRYFAYERDGVAYCWADGATKWSGEGMATPWPQCRRPTDEELESL